METEPAADFCRIVIPIRETLSAVIEKTLSGSYTVPGVVKIVQSVDCPQILTDLETVTAEVTSYVPSATTIVIPLVTRGDEIASEIVGKSPQGPTVKSAPGHRSLDIVYGEHCSH